MEVYVFDKDLDLLGIIESYLSLRWVRKYSHSGSFEIHCTLNKKTLELLKIGNIVWKNDDKEAGYIEYRHLTLDENGTEIMIVSGNFLTGYLGRRYIHGTENFDTTVELAIRKMIEDNVTNPTNADRKIESIELGALKNIVAKTNHQVSDSNLLLEVENLALLHELGIKSIVDFKEKKITFDMYEGLDRTSGQNSNPRAIFSKEFENVLQQDYTESTDNYKNVASILGENEVRVPIGSGKGLSRHELVVDAKDVKKETMTAAEYEDKLKERGKLKLSEFENVKTFESKINLQSNLIYKKDFNLGDIVTCKSREWDVTVDTRITEIEEVYENNGKSINIVFGNNIPGLIEKIKGAIK